MSDELLCLPSPEDPGRPKNDSANGGTSAAATRLVNTPATTPVATPSTSPARVPATTTAAALPARRQRSRGNAVRHGLTAVTLVEDLIEKLLGEAAYEHLATVLRQEFGAEGPLEEMLIGRATQHVAALELGRQAELAALREGCRQAAVLVGVPFPTQGVDAADAAGAQAGLIDAPLRGRLQRGVGAYHALQPRPRARASGRRKSTAAPGAGAATASVVGPGKSRLWSRWDPRRAPGGSR